MIKKVLQLLVFLLTNAVGDPLKAVPAIASDPCYTYCEGVKVGIRHFYDTTL